VLEDRDFKPDFDLRPNAPGSGLLWGLQGRLHANANAGMAANKSHELIWSDDVIPLV
jgi:hypothetical protein